MQKPNEEQQKQAEPLTSRSAPPTRDNKPSPHPEPYHKSNKDAEAFSGSTSPDKKATPQTVREDESVEGEHRRSKKQEGK